MKFFTFNLYAFVGEQSITLTFISKTFVEGSIHRSTRVENPGEGVPDGFCQNPKGGVKGFRKNYLGVPLFRVLLHFYKQVFRNLPEGGIIFTLPPHPHLNYPPPMCIYGSITTLICVGSPHSY